jgi:hypothetical protein
MGDPDEPVLDEGISLGRATLSVLAVVAICAVAVALRYVLAAP